MRFRPRMGYSRGEGGSTVLDGRHFTIRGGCVIKGLTCNPYRKVGAENSNVRRRVCPLSEYSRMHPFPDYRLQSIDIRTALLCARKVYSRTTTRSFRFASP